MHGRSQYYAQEVQAIEWPKAREGLGVGRCALKRFFKIRFLRIKSSI